MRSHDAQRASAERAGGANPPAGGLSRRSVLQGAATAGAAGLAVTALGAAVNPAAAATSQSAPGGGGAATAASGSIVVHVRNAGSGDIEVFSGTSQTRLRDKDLASRIARAVG